jgi:hypothetical protein
MRRRRETSSGIPDGRLETRFSSGEIDESAKRRQHTSCHMGVIAGYLPPCGGESDFSILALAKC